MGQICLIEQSNDVHSRLTQRVQITADGNFAYRNSIENSFGDNGVDFAQLIKPVYGNAPESETRYSPAECIEAKKTIVIGKPR